MINAQVPPNDQRNGSTKVERNYPKEDDKSDKCYTCPRKAKYFNIPAEGFIFSISIEDGIVTIGRSKDDGISWEIAIELSTATYRCWSSAFQISDDECQDTESLLEMIRFLQQGYILPNGAPLPNRADPAKKWSEILLSGAAQKKIRVD